MSLVSSVDKIPVIDSAPAAPAPPVPALRWMLHQIAIGSVVLAVACAALLLGLILRRYAWDQTEPIRYQLDINNAFRQGSASLEVGSTGHDAAGGSGYIDRYDERTSEPGAERGGLDLDYAPGRLAIATLWARWVRQQPEWKSSALQGMPAWQQDFFFYARARSIKKEYQLLEPMLMINLTGEILSAIAMFLLVRRYTTGKLPLLRPTRGIFLGLCSALLFWFNPALIWNAHCWPQWDSWVLPFYLWAVLLASLDWWFCAGALIAAGAMFKGQILFGAPFFIFWPLFQGRVPALLRWIVGLATATAGITAVWLVRTPGSNPTGHHFIHGSVNISAIHWVIYLAIIFLALSLLIYRPQKKWMWIPFAIALAVLACMIRPLQLLVPDRWQSVLIAAVAMGILIYLMRLRALPFAAAGWIATALLTCTPLFHTSSGWFDLGIAYGTHHFEDKLGHGDPNNLPELLQEWQWDDLMAPAFTLPAGKISDSVSSFLVAVDPGVRDQRIRLEDGSIGVPLKYLMVSIWLLSVILCCIGAAIHDRNRSPRFLIAIATPWILFFALMVQMHQRYLLYGASLSAAAAVISPGFLFLHLFLSVVAMSQEMHSMLGDGGRFRGNEVYRFLENWHPGIAWAVLLCAAIFLYSSIKPGRRQTR